MKKHTRYTNFLRWYSEVGFILTRICIPAFRQGLWSLGWYFMLRSFSIASDSLMLKSQSQNQIEKQNPFVYTMQ